MDGPRSLWAPIYRLLLFQSVQIPRELGVALVELLEFVPPVCVTPRAVAAACSKPLPKLVTPAEGVDGSLAGSESADVVVTSGSAGAKDIGSESGCDPVRATARPLFELCPNARARASSVLWIPGPYKARSDAPYSCRRKVLPASATKRTAKRALP